METKFFLFFRYENEYYFRRKAVGCSFEQLIDEISNLVKLAGFVDFSVGLHDLEDVEYKSWCV